MTLNAANSLKAQEAALMMDANNSLSHSPPTSWACYTADGATAAGSSNLALGNSGPSAIHAYMADTGTPSLGHRRWVLYSRLGQVGTGDTPRANDLWVFGNEVTAPASATANGVAWPSPGFVPRTNRVADPTHPWSFSVPGADFSKATVTMTDDKNQALTLGSVAQLPNGYGDNTFSWKLTAAAAQWDRGASDTKLNVQINNVIVAGQAKNFQYSVTFFAP